MEVLDRFIYNCFAKLDDAISFVETYIIKMTEWCWHTRVKLLKKKRKKKMRRAILQALEDRYNAQISEADATIKIYLESSVGIGEHPQHIDEIDKLIEKIANAQEKLKELQI